MVIRQTSPSASSPAFSGAAIAARSLALAACITLFSGAGYGQDDDTLQLELEGAMEGFDAAETIAEPDVVEPFAAQRNESLDEIGSEIDGMVDSAGDEESVPENARDQFDSDLRDRMPATFSLYKRLSEDKRNQVFDEYQVSGDYLRARSKIIELRKAK